MNESTIKKNVSYIVVSFFLNLQTFNKRNDFSKLKVLGFESRNELGNDRVFQLYVQ